MNRRTAAFVIVGLILAVVAVLVLRRGDDASVPTDTPTSASIASAPIVTITYQTALTPRPSSPPELIVTRYQAFEHGFMVQVVSQDCVYAYADSIVLPLSGVYTSEFDGDYVYCVPFAGLPENLMTPPDGLLVPSGAFGLVWGYYDEVRDSLGYATEAEATYLAPLPPPVITLGGGPFYTPLLTLPDGRVLACGFRGATRSSCYIE